MNAAIMVGTVIMLEMPITPLVVVALAVLPVRLPVIEDAALELDEAAALELELDPNRAPGLAFASAEQALALAFLWPTGEPILATTAWVSLTLMLTVPS
jgi:hypothetical protein